ncbi:MAG: hypothetical protein K2W93_20165, partial [Burkholderiaceae bacterium]|nr:hypothetical protein [Burkholderiaceae bacterium]
MFEEFALLLKQESVFAGVAQAAGSDLFSVRGAPSRLGEAAASPAFSHEWGGARALKFVALKSSGMCCFLHCRLAIR